MADEEPQAAQPRRPNFRAQRQATPEEVLRRNYVERVKKERSPYDLADDYDRLAAASYEDVPEEDMLRLQWHGLYHDKPKIGFMMMRIKLPNGMLTPARLRLLGELAEQYGRSVAELTTRQDVQLHWIQLSALPEILARLDGAGLTTRGGCGDVLRNITGCPASGVDAEQRFDATAVVLEAHRRFSGNPDFGDLPRKHKWSISACPYHCNGPEVHDVALVGTHQDGWPGFAVWVGGGLSSSPRIGKSLGVFVAPDEALDVPRAIMQVWSADLNYRMSRAKARFKFMVDDHGPAKIRELVEAQLGRRLTDLEEDPRPIGRTDHMGVRPQVQPGLFYIGFPVHLGQLRAEQMIRTAEVAESLGGEIRLTREQNLILTGVPEARVEETLARMRDEAELSLDVNPIRGHSIGCTGEPHCNFAVGETKGKLGEIIEHLEGRLGAAAADLRLHLDGCPHACGQHWVGDIGIQGTTLKIDGVREEAYDLLLRGGLGASAGVGKAVVRRVPSREVKYYVERLLMGYLSDRRDGEPIQAFFSRWSDEELAALARGDSLAMNWNL
ncbi:nitrite/sulfite reductase [Planctomyces sp. SH-PL62]|uniref:nitrite/sulfite reductase n=1 Tax=Planctomyces sp. SH-PL62 TaxID=1636152 RepID=UPI00078B9177|nr:nitrite/sulfite reductase [Planctomyces sp. SH-PL62]AMV41028.1 Sulfite reductase [Planctomyces sp. SH-PL62]